MIVGGWLNCTFPGSASTLRILEVPTRNCGWTCRLGCTLREGETSRVNRPIRQILALMIVAGGLGAASQAEPNGPAADIVRTVDRMTYEGFIESQDDRWVHLIQIQRSDRRTHLLVRPIELNRVAEVVRAGASARERLRTEIDAFRNRAAIESARMESIVLAIEPPPSLLRFRYDGAWFILRSDLPEEESRRAAVRLEQMFTAYRQILPPRVEPSRPPELALFGTLSSFHDYLARRGVQTDRAALFLPADNLVIAGSDLNRSAAQLAEVRRDHQRLLDELRTLERELRPRLNATAERMRLAGVAPEEIAKTLSTTRRELERQIAEKRLDVQRADRRNEELFLKLAGRMFAQLYHEGWHAYLENFVFPHRQYAVPLWLNEGLAQLFEVAQPESGNLRIDTLDRERLRRLAADVSSQRPLALADVVAADARQFLDPREGERFYSYAYGIAYHLAFEEERMTPGRIEQYVGCSKAEPPDERFAQLVGATLDDYELRFRRWVSDTAKRRG